MHARDNFIKINNYARKTRETKVNLEIQGSEDIEEMRLARNNENINKQRWIKYDEEKDFFLEDDYGEQEIRVQFKDEQGNLSDIYSDNILYKPQGSPEVRLDDGAKYTSDRNVEVELIPPKDANQMRIANIVEIEDSNWDRINREFSWQLKEGYGEKEVFVQFRKPDGSISSLFSDVIYFRKKPDFSINSGDDVTNNRLVELNFDLPKGYKKVKISNSNNFSTSRTIENPNQIDWLLAKDEGYKNVSVKFIANRTTKTVEKIISFESNHNIPSGSVVTSKDYGWQPYYLGFDRKLHPFPSTEIFHSWYDDFSEVKILEPGKLSKFPIGFKICARSGSWLVKFDFPKIFIPQPGCKLRPIRSSVEANLAFGDRWDKRVIDLNKDSRDTAPYFKSNFSVAQPQNEIYDSDQDGIQASKELNFSTSDENPDTDNDGLSDFEEIKIFQSSPTEKDSNNNGRTDSEDIIDGKSPIFKNTNIQINNNYFLPLNGLIKQKRLFYRHFGKTLTVNPERLRKIIYYALLELNLLMEPI